VEHLVAPALRLDHARVVRDEARLGPQLVERAGQQPGALGAAAVGEAHGGHAVAADRRK
jgi:hypothetical protein